MNAREALLSVEKIVREYGDSKALGSYFLEFGRRLEVLMLVERYCARGASVVDLGAQPFIISCALRAMGYDVTAVDIEPEPYMPVAERCGVRVVRRDLERERLDIHGADCIVFTEVMEHLHYYYVPRVLSEINKSLKPGGYLILTTPNIASLFRRLRLLFGRQPIYRHHVREYTMPEVLAMLERAGFRPVEFYYSSVNDLTYVDAEPEDYKCIRSYADLLKLAVKKPTRLNLLRAAAYPLVKLMPSLRMLIVVVSQKHREPAPATAERWG